MVVWPPAERWFIVEDRKEKQLDKAVGVLNIMFDNLTERGSSVFAERDSEKEQILVHVNGAEYVVDVACENVNGMIKSVVDAVILKI